MTTNKPELPFSIYQIAAVMQHTLYCMTLRRVEQMLA